MAQIVVIGDANVDLLVHLPDRTSGELDLSNSVPQLHGGGSAANVAVALARLDLSVAMVGSLGDDGYGRWVRDDLARENVATGGLCLLEDAFTPMVLALIEPGGERLVVVWPPQNGAHLLLPMDGIDHTLISGGDWLHTTGVCLRASPARETILFAMKSARESGVTVSLDLNLRLELWDLDDETRRTFGEAIELSDVVFGNAAEEIIPLAGIDTAEASAEHLCDGKRTIVTRLGAEGALVSTPDGTVHVPAFEASVVDTLGAGDAFSAGFIAARLSELEVREATRWGHAVAALKIGRTGARGLPSLQEVLKVLRAR